MIYYDFVEEKNEVRLMIKLKLENGKEIVLFDIDSKLINTGVNFTAVKIDAAKGTFNTGITITDVG